MCATSAGYVMLRLPGAVERVFTDWLSRVKPDAEEKVLAKIREVRDGAMSDSTFRRRMCGTGTRADNISGMFKLFSKKNGLQLDPKKLRCDLFFPPSDPTGQMSLF